MPHDNCFIGERKLCQFFPQAQHVSCCVCADLVRTGITYMAVLQTLDMHDTPAILLAPWITNLALWSRIHAKVWMGFLLGQHGALGHPCCSSQKSAEVCHSSMVSATRACHGHHPLWLRSYQRQPLDRPFCPSPLRALGQNPSPFFPRRFAVRLCG